MSELCVSCSRPLATGGIPGSSRSYVQATRQLHLHTVMIFNRLLLVIPLVVARTVDRIVATWKQPPQKVPTPGVPDGPLLGNGRLGAVVSFSSGLNGSHPVAAEVAFHMGHNSFFAAPTSNVSSCGYTDITRGGRKALGGLRLRFRGAHLIGVPRLFPRNGTFVAMLLGEAGLVRLTAFVHATEDVLLVNLTGPSAKVDVSVWTYTGCSGAPNPKAAGTDRLPTSAAASSEMLQVSRADGWEYQARGYKVREFHLIARTGSLANAHASESCEGLEGPCSMGTLVLRGAAAVSLDMLAIKLGARPKSPPSHCWSQLEAAHREVWAAFWSKSFIRIPASPVTEFFWYMSQYILRISSMGDASPGLFGPFVTDDQVNWMGDLTLNYNAEATYYGTCSSNHLETLEPYIQTILDFLPAAKVLAQGQFPQCPNAVYFPGHILPYGVTTADNGDMGQRQMGIFAALPLILYWRYTSDPAFAARVLPLFEGLAQFWDCALTKTQDDRLHDLVDCAEELCSPDGQNQPDPTVTLSILPGFFDAAADMAASLGRPAHVQ